MRKGALVRAPRRARIDSLNRARREATSDSLAGKGIRSAYYMALGRVAWQNMRSRVDSWLDMLRRPTGHRRDDEAEARRFDDPHPR